MANSSLDAERLNRFFKGGFSEGDKDYLRKIFCDKSNEGELEHFVKKQWYELLKENSAEEKNLDHVLYRIHFELNQGVRNQKTKRNSGNYKLEKRIAAILFLPLLIYTGIQFFTSEGKSDLTWVEIKAPAWTRVQFSLPDGSSGWLNSSSSVKYRGDFNKDRKVSLDGEAFFDVKTNPAKPFEVSTDEIIVTAAGTKFNIASYKNEKEVEVVLEEGSIVFNNLAITSPVTMNPNELLVYNKSSHKFNTEKVQAEKYLAWTEGKLVFRNDPIDVVARRLGRWYNVDVEVSGNNYEEVRLRATFIDENLEEVLYFLRQALPVDYIMITGEMDTDNETFIKKKIIFTMRK
jgi:ferric-dicitrate binding protein FerR (iron transport regulator)